MLDFVFSPRYLLGDLHNPDRQVLRDLILNASEPGREYGEATIRFPKGTPSAWLYILHDRSLGCSLWYNDRRETWLPIGDAARMTELVCPDDIKSPAGSFLTPTAALPVIEEFCCTGERSAAVEWVRLSDLPISDAEWEA